MVNLLEVVIFSSIGNHDRLFILLNEKNLYEWSAFDGFILINVCPDNAYKSIVKEKFDHSGHRQL